MPEKGQVDDLRATLAEMGGYDAVQMVARSEWGAINFTTLQDSLQTSFEMAKRLSVLPLDKIPDQPFSQLHQQSKQFKTVLTQIQGFNIAGNNPVQQRDQIITSVRSQCGAYVNTATPWLPILSMLYGPEGAMVQQLNTIIREATEASASQVTHATEVKKQLDQAKQDLEKLMTAARDTAGTVGVSVHAKDFESAAIDNASSAKAWLIASAIFGIVTLSVLVISFVEIKTQTDNETFIQLVILRILGFSVLLGTTIWCSRMYKAYKHQEAMNLFRRNALRTFETFIAAASDKQAKDAVLRETTRSIFAITPTGYLDGSDGKEPATTIMEVIRQTIDKDK